MVPLYEMATNPALEAMHTKVTQPLAPVDSIYPLAPLVDTLVPTLIVCPLF